MAQVYVWGKYNLNVKYEEDHSAHAPKQGDINLDQYVLLEKVTHTWANDDHTMEFETLGLEHV
jgi:hypothetical protein